MSFMSFITAMLSYLTRLFTGAPRQEPVEELPPAKVAIIGAGIGGCFAAKFLRENGGSNLDIHIFAKKGSKIGGRTAVFQFHSHLYETGASVIHSKNKYLSDTAKKHGLEKKGEDDPNIPVGIFNGKSLLCFSAYKIVSYAVLLWRYGLDLFRMNSTVSTCLKKFCTIYDLQASGKTYKTIEDILFAMGGEEMKHTMKVSAQEYMVGEKHWNARLVDELVQAALLVNYDQGTSVNAFTTLVSLAGMEDGSLWSVVGGNYKIAECALNDSAHNSLVMEDVISVCKSEDGGVVKYTIKTESGRTEEDYDAVIVANPLNLSSIEYQNFSDDVYTAAAKTPYQRTVATIVKGKINQQYFGAKSADTRNFPLAILTNDMESFPFAFSALQVQIPSEIGQDAVRNYLVPLHQEPVRVWKIFSPEPLTEEQLQQLFTEFSMSDVKVHDWLAYPQYHPPDEAPPFVLEDGVFYVNAVEKAASAMEMSAIGAKNAALLAREYLLKSQVKN